MPVLHYHDQMWASHSESERERERERETGLQRLIATTKTFEAGEWDTEFINALYRSFWSAFLTNQLPPPL